MVKPTKVRLGVSLCTAIIAVGYAVSCSALAFDCWVEHVYDLAEDRTLEKSVWDEDFRGSKFTVDHSSGAIDGTVLPTFLARSTEVVNPGFGENSFKAIADFGNQFQLIEIQVFQPGSKKPFVAASMGGAGIVTGHCN